MQEISELNPALNEEHLTIQAMQAEMSQLKTRNTELERKSTLLKLLQEWATTTIACGKQVASKNKQNTLILHNSMPAFFKVLLLGTIQS